MAGNLIGEKDYTTLKAIGDGNCLFRSIIQSLLIQGLINNKKTWVIEFIRELVQRTETVLRLKGMEISAEYIAALKDNSDFKGQVQINGATLTMDTPPSFHEFIKKYQSLSLEQWNDFSSTYFNNNNPPILYYLSACLRQDLSEHILKNAPNTEAASRCAILHKYAALSDFDDYFYKYKIRPYLNTPIHPLIFEDHSIVYPDVPDREISIYLKFTDVGGAHYDALLLTEKLPLKQTETDAEKLQPEEIPSLSKPEPESISAPELTIKTDQALAKTMQMKEIEDFAERFKSSGNKDNRSFINDVIKGLGLEKELSHEQLSHLRALQNSTTIEQIVQSLQSVINDLGYSSQFKEQIQHHSFFSTCRQEVVDTAQTLKSTPAIQCN